MRILASTWRRVDYLTLACALTLVLLPYFVFWPVTLGKQIWRGGDFSTQNYPWFVVCTEQWRRAHLPLWNPYVYAGAPLAAAQQASVFYPLNVLLWLFLPPSLAMGFSVLVHLSLTGLSVFVFIRSLHLHPIAALIGGLTFQMGGFVMSHLGHLSILRSLPWIGFTLQGFNAWIDSRKTRYLCIISISIGLLLMSGHPQITLYSIFLISTYFMFARRVGHTQMVLGLLALGLGIGLGALQIIPGAYMWFTQEYLPRSESTYESFLAHSFHPAYLLTLLFPRARAGTYAEMVAYVGIAPLLLSLLSFFLVQHDEEARIKRFFGVWAVVALLLSCGRFIPLLPKWLFAVPIYGSVSRVPSRHLLELCFSLAVLAALGMNGMLFRSRARKLGWPMLMGLTLALAGWILLAIFSPFSIETPSLHWDTWRGKVVIQPLILLLLSAVLLIAIWRVHQKKYRELFIALLILLVAADLVDFGFPIYARGLVLPSFYEPPTVAGMIRKSLSEGPLRVISFEATGDDKALLAPNYNAAYGIESVIGYDAHAFMLRQFYVAFDGLIPSWGYVSSEAIEQTRFRTLLDLLGVKYLLVRSRKTDHFARYYTKVGSVEGVDIYLNERARPRLFAAMPPEITMKTLQTFGDKILLVDYSLRKSNISGEYVLVTWWTCRSPIPEDYTLYVHYIDTVGNILAQDDHLLIARFVGGPSPTSQWICSGYYRDESYVPKELLSRKQLRIAVGLWIPQTGERLPSSGELPVDERGRTLLEIENQEQVDETTEAVLLDEYGRIWIASPKDSPGSQSVKLLYYEGDRIAADVSFERDGVLVHSSNDVSGWKARIDGAPAPILRINGFLQGVFVPEGQHRVEFWYDPESVKWGAAISLVSLCATVMLGALPRQKGP